MEISPWQEDDLFFNPEPNPNMSNHTVQTDVIDPWLHGLLDAKKEKDTWDRLAVTSVLCDHLEDHLCVVVPVLQAFDQNLSGVGVDAKRAPMCVRQRVLDLTVLPQVGVTGGHLGNVSTGSLK